MSYDIPDEDSPSGWWKTDVVARVAAEERRPSIWTDDDLDAEDPHLSVGLADHLTLAPDPSHGLTRADLDVVFGFLGGVHHRAEVADPAPAPSTEADQSGWIEHFPNYMGWTNDEILRIIQASPPRRLDDLLIMAEDAMHAELDLPDDASDDEIREAIRQRSEG